MYIRTHKLIGATATMLLLSPTPHYLIPFILASNIGSTSPDFDHEFVRKKYSIFIPIYFVLLLYPLKLISISIVPITGIVLYLLVLASFSFSKHRTLSHSLVGLFLFTASTSLISTKLILPMTTGYILHLIADSFTKTGIKLFDYTASKSYGLKLFNMYDIGDNVFFIISLMFFFTTLVLKYNIMNLILNIFNYLNMFLLQ